jgi:hypothetical protein
MTGLQDLRLYPKIHLEKRFERWLMLVLVNELIHGIQGKDF